MAAGLYPHTSLFTKTDRKLSLSLTLNGAGHGYYLFILHIKKEDDHQKNKKLSENHEKDNMDRPFSPNFYNIKHELLKPVFALWSTN